MQDAFLDAILKVTPSEATAEKIFLPDDNIFRDHFPNYPILPAAIQMECTTRLLQIASWVNTNFSKTPIVFDFESFKFYQQIKPNDKLFISIDLYDKMRKALAKIMIGNQMVLEGYLAYQYFPFDDFHTRKIVQQTLTQLGYRNGNFI